MITVNNDDKLLQQQSEPAKSSEPESDAVSKFVSRALRNHDRASIINVEKEKISKKRIISKILPLKTASLGSRVTPAVASTFLHKRESGARERE